MGAGNWSMRSFAGFEDAIVVIWDQSFREGLLDFEEILLSCDWKVPSVVSLRGK